MKLILLTVTWFSLLTLLPAQHPDTVFVSSGQENGSLETQRFTDRYDFVFGSHQPTRFLLKWNVLPLVLPLGYERIMDDNFALINALDQNRLDLAAELKLTKAFALLAGGSFHSTGNGTLGGRQRITEWRVEPRYYFNQPARIRRGESANNLSGNYIGLEYQQIEFTRPGVSKAVFRDFSTSASLRFGWQRRLFRYGYFDASAGLGFQSRQSTYFGEAKDYLSFHTRIGAGLAFGAPNRKQSAEPDYCDVFRCFQEDRQMLKADLLSLLRMDAYTVLLKPELAYERKIGSSSFSVELAVRYQLFAFHDLHEGIYLQVRESSFGLSVEPRWYFLQQRRIAQGKSGNNLSGVFVALKGGLEWIDQRPYAGTPLDENGLLGSNNLYFSPALGVQHRVFRKGFISYKFGLVWDHQQFEGTGLGDPSGFLSEVKMGVAF